MSTHKERKGAYRGCLYQQVPIPTSAYQQVPTEVNGVGVHVSHQLPVHKHLEALVPLRVGGQPGSQAGSTGGGA